MKLYPCCFEVIEGDDKDIVAGRWQREIEDKDGRGLDLDHASRRFVDLHHSALFEQCRTRGVEQTHRQLVATQFGAPTPQVEHEVRSRMHGGELGDHDLTPDAQHGKFPVLIHHRVVGEHRKIDERTQLTRIEVMTSPCLIALTTSIPLVTYPKTVCTPSR